MGEKNKSNESIKTLFDTISPYFDEWAEVFQEKVYGYVTWEHLKKHIPKDRNSLILDAGGGTGRWAIPLAKMGYNVMLCDISEGMLKQAKKNIDKEKLSEKIALKKEDVTKLSFPDEMFDFVLCEDGPVSIADSQKVVRELGRVLKKDGKMWACVVGRYPLALVRAEKSSEKALKIIKGEINYVRYKGVDSNRVFSPKEVQNLFQENDIEVIKMYGNRIVTAVLSKEIQRTMDFDDKFFSEIRELEYQLSEEPSLLGMAKYLQIVGRK